jgi:mono/diheme cytochrome c family protein
MNEEQKKQYKEKYALAKQHGVKFWPDIIYKDLLISFALFLVLIIMATFIGVAVEPKADPSDSAYIPRPEWYFLFLFKFLAIYGAIPWLGKIEWIAASVIPAIAVGVLFIVPWLDRSADRHSSKRVLPLMIMATLVVTIVTLTLISEVPTAYGEGLYIPGILQVISGLVLPGGTLAALILFAIFIKKNANKVMLWTTGISSFLIVAITMATLILAPAKAAIAEVQVASTLPEMILAGQDLYSVNCAECHGAEGEGGEVKGVEGFEGVILTPIASSDVMYTFDDASLGNVVAYGQPGLDPAMPPFGRAYGGALGPSDIDAMVTFMRYTWDDRAVLPPEVLQANTMPTLAEGEAPSYEVHISAIVRRYCVSCHREGKKNNNYWMSTYEEIINSGDHAPNLITGDLNCNTIQMLNRVEGLEAGNPMPPTRALSPELIAIWQAWVLAGMPNTAAEAAALSAGGALPTPLPSGAYPPPVGPQAVVSPTPYPPPVGPQAVVTPTPYPPPVP